MKDSAATRASSKESARALPFLLSFTYVALWYVFSAATLILNKYVLSYLGAEPEVVGCFQMGLAATCSGANVLVSRMLDGQSSGAKNDSKKSFYRNVGILGVLRYVLGRPGLLDEA